MDDSEWDDFCEIASLQELKQKGHDLLDEYVALDQNRRVKEARAHAYTKLTNKLNRMYGTGHFAHMKTPEEVIEALNTLRRMIKQRKKKYEHLRRDNVFLSHSKMKEAIANLAKGGDNVTA